MGTELKMLPKLKRDFENYCSTVPVFGLNSSRYDLNLLKECLLHHLLTEKDVVPNVIGMGNNYIGINVLSMHIFLTACGTSEEKGFFTYEWFDSTEKLNVPQLSPINNFWSKLKNQNVLAIEFDKFLQMNVEWKKQF